MGICKMYKKIQQMNLEYIKKNNTYEIEFPNARGVVNYLHYHDVTKKPPPFNFVLSPNGEVYNDM